MPFYEKLKHRRERGESIVEAPQGYVEVLFEGPFDWDLLTSDLGTTFQLVSPGFNIKRYPAYITTQWPIEAALTLQQKHNVRLEDVTSLEIEIPAGRTDRSQPDLRSGLASKFSMEYCGAAALAEGRVDLDTFSDSRRFSPHAEAALRKMRVVLNPDIPTDIRRTWAVARVRLQDGREISENYQSYRGSIANPMSRDERLDKFTACAQCVLKPDDVERTLALVEALEDLPDLRQLMAILTQRPPG